MQKSISQPFPLVNDENYMKKPKKIILLEDNPADVKLAELALRALPFQTKLLHFFNGQDFINYLGKVIPDEVSFILLDLNMPKANGFEVIKEVRKDRRFNKIPIVVFTCSASKTDIQHCYKLGANAYVNKPVDLIDFERTMHSIVEFWSKTNIHPRHN